VTRLVAAAVVLLASVFGLLGTAAWNRRDPVQRITLTERELELPWTWENGRDDDDAELRLRFAWQQRANPQDARTWLTSDRLRELGFTVGVPAGAPEAEHVYGRALPRIGWVVFEVDGPAWQTIDRRRAMRPLAQDRYSYQPAGPSRMVPIDAGVDLTALSNRHGGAGVVVMPAVVQMRYENHPAQGPVVWAWIAQLVSNSVSVPLHLRPRLAGLPRLSRAMPPAWKEGDPLPEPSPPRYEVDLAIGRLGAPWIEDVRRIK
jgi:hypothetical protein